MTKIVSNNRKSFKQKHISYVISIYFQKVLNVEKKT